MKGFTTVMGVAEASCKDVPAPACGAPGVPPRRLYLAEILKENVPSVGAKVTLSVGRGLIAFHKEHAVLHRFHPAVSKSNQPMSWASRVCLEPISHGSVTQSTCLTCDKAGTAGVAAPENVIIFAIWRNLPPRPR